MLNLFIRVLKFLVLVVPLLIAIIDCNDDDDDKDKSTIYATTPTVEIPPIAGHLVIDFADYITETDLKHFETDLGVPIYWAHEESWDEALAIVYVNNMAEAYHTLRECKHHLASSIEVIEPQMTLHLESSAANYPNDPMYEQQWHLDAMGAPYGWAHTPRGKGVIVAVADTGVTVVEDLQKTHVLEGKSFVDNNPADRHGHGTHVAGTIAQSTNNGIGTAGVAPAATILPVKVLTDQGYGTTDGIAAGIDWAVDQGAQVINMSLGGGYSKVIHNAIIKATEKGVIVVAACGNSAVDKCGYPGGLKETIGVSATGPDGKLSYYSSYGKGVDIAAPGGDKKSGGETGGVLQATPRGYEWYQGTSMATPHVAGAAAIILSTGVSTDNARAILLATADNSDEDQLHFGQGKLDLEAAVKMAQGYPDGEHNHLGLFIVAALLGLAITIFGETSKEFMAKVVVISALFGGGLFFLPYIPYLSGPIVEILATPLLEWPDLIFTIGASGFPLWASIAFPAALGFVLGVHKITRPIATGLALGFGTSLLWAAAAGTITVWALPGVFGSMWLAANGIGCILLGLAFSGSQHLEEEADV